ncbi:MAG TPA: XRE family transcriptional regulator, partial [Propionibacteriaceae bacterium]|nr:XRE family transcriptional regulator [Propionibacteriaceae bacterium]
RVEQGRVASPGFFFVGAVARTLNVPLDEVFGEAIGMKGGAS